MTYDIMGAGALDYLPCHYGTSKLTFRGPERDMQPPYLVFLGGTQTFGKFIEQPFPLKVEHLTGIPSVNFGQVNAGLDVYLSERVVLDATKDAYVTVVEVLGAANLSNQFYTVHPRRNDRFLRASQKLIQLFPEVDFTQFNFTQHMLIHLHKTDDERFSAVAHTLRRTWARKMRQLLGRLEGPVVLLRVGGQGQGEVPPKGWHEHIAPAFVTDAMLKAVLPLTAAFVDVPYSEGQRKGRMRNGLVPEPMLEHAARAVIDSETHSAVARALLPVLDGIMQKGPP